MPSNCAFTFCPGTSFADTVQLTGPDGENTTLDASCCSVRATPSQPGNGWTGHSTHHLCFPGTLSVRQMHYIELIRDLCEWIVTMGGRRIFLLNGHDGNDVPVRAALREIKSGLAGAANVRIGFASLSSLEMSPYTSTA